MFASAWEGWSQQLALYLGRCRAVPRGCACGIMQYGLIEPMWLGKEDKLPHQPVLRCAGMP